MKHMYIDYPPADIDSIREAVSDEHYDSSFFLDDFVFRDLDRSSGLMRSRIHWRLWFIGECDG